MHLSLSTAKWRPFCLGLNSLAPGKFEWNFRYLIFQIISVIDGWSISCELALKWMWLNFTDDKSTLVQVMAWCRQATSHYLSQCWPKSLSPYGVTRPQWVNVFVLWSYLLHCGHPNRCVCECILYYFLPLNLTLIYTATSCNRVCVSVYHSSFSCTPSLSCFHFP